MAPGPRLIRSAGAVVSRPGGDVLLVHRPRYDDWSFPKGKLERGEHVVTAAVREVLEETGLQVRLGPALPTLRYPVNSGEKEVRYWTARVVGDDDVSGYRPNAEIDRVRWVPWAAARDLLTYPRDVGVLDAAEPLRRRTRPVLVLRHARARSRRRWAGEDSRRPLLAAGRDQAQRLVPLLAGLGVSDVLTSTSTRCVETVRPFLDAHAPRWQGTAELSEEGAPADGRFPALEAALAGRDPLLVCTHRPVLPAVLRQLGVPPVPLAPGECLVVHTRRNRVVATELLQPGP